MCSVHAATFGIDEAAAVVIVADELRARFLPLMHSASLTQVAAHGPTEATTSAEESAESVVSEVRTMATAGTAAIPNKKPKKRANLVPMHQTTDAREKDLENDRDLAIHPAFNLPTTPALTISPEADASRKRVMDQLNLAKNDLDTATKIISRSFTPQLTPVSQGLAHATFRISSAFNLIEEWIEGVPFSDKKTKELHGPEACAKYMARIGRIHRPDSSYEDTFAGDESDEEPEPVRVGHLFACPYANPVTNICKLGCKTFKLNRIRVVRAHLFTQRHRHRPSPKNGFVANGTTAL